LSWISLLNANSYRQKESIDDTVSDPAANISITFPMITVSVNFSTNKILKNPKLTRLLQYSIFYLQHTFIK